MEVEDINKNILYYDMRNRNVLKNLNILEKDIIDIDIHCIIDDFIIEYAIKIKHNECPDFIYEHVRFMLLEEYEKEYQIFKREKKLKRILE